MLNPKWSVWSALVLVVLVLQSPRANALAYSWNGGTGSWITTTMWTPNGTPGAGDDVTINAGSASNVDVSGSQACNSITIGGGSFSQVVGVSGSLSIGTTGTINVLGSITTNYMSSITGTGTLTNNAGTISMSDGTLSVQTVNNNATFNIIGTITSAIISSQTFNNSGIITWNGTTNISLNNVNFTNTTAGAFSIKSIHSISGTGASTFVNNGTLEMTSGAPTGTASLGSTIAVTNNSTIIVDAGYTLAVANLVNYNSGASSLSGGTFLLNGVLQLTNGGTITTNSATLTFGAATGNIFNNVGAPMLSSLVKNTVNASIVLSNGANLTASSPFINDGAIYIGSSCSFNVGSGKLTISSTGTIIPSSGTISAGTGIDIQGGSLIGSGMISGSVNNNGTLGTTSGAPLSISGNFVQTSAGDFIPQISSTLNPGTLLVSGSAALDGTILPAVGYPAQTGDSLKVVSAGSVTGQFASVSPMVTPNGFLITQNVTATAANLQIGVAAPTTPPIILSATADNTAVALNVPVSFSASAIDPSNFPLTYLWDFGDATPQGSGPTVTHAFTSEAIWTVTLTVTNGITSATAVLPIFALGPNSGGAGIPNLSDGQSSANPLNGLSITLLKSDGGLCQFQIDINALIRDAFSASTAFDTIDGRSSTVVGLSPAFKADNSNIYIATTTATNISTNNVAGKARKTIGMSGAEVGATPKVKTPPKNHQITSAKTKGKFIFGKPTGATRPVPDTVSFSGSFELPEGLDLSPSSTQDFQFSIGNILDSVTLNSKGKMVGVSKMGRIKKLTVIFPHLPKGQTLTSAGQMAKFSVSISQTGLSTGGFDTEGITASYAASEKSLKSVKRSIQVAMVFAGVVWQVDAPVTYTLSAKGDSGAISGRSGQ